MKRLLSGISMALAGIIVGASTLVAPVAAHAISNGTCQNLPLPVSMSPGLTANQTVVGTLCTPTVWADGTHQVDVLIHGATYNRTYWDMPVGNGQYSYVDKTLGAGRATFAYDALGAGDSSRPLGALLTTDSSSFVLHQVITWLRAAKGYTQVNGISHSLGTSALINEAGTYNDLNRVVTTGYVHHASILVLLKATSFYPAVLDPQFSGLLDPFFLTTMPGTRSSLFYNSTADPAVVAYDEANKDLVAAGQIAGAGLDLEGPAILSMSRHITAPVLVVVGDQDTLVCSSPTPYQCSNEASIVTNETPYYSSASNVTALSIVNTGHDLTLHPSATTSFNGINAWMASH